MFENVLKKLPILETQPLSAVVYRAVSLAYYKNPLSGLGSYLSGGRYNKAEQFEALYCSESSETVLRELDYAFSENARFQSKAKTPYALFAIVVSLNQVLNLYESKNLDILGIDQRDLTREWSDLAANEHPVLPQAIGSWCFDNRIEGLIVPSARQENRANLVLFPANFIKGTKVNLHHKRNIPITEERLKKAREAIAKMKKGKGR